MDRHKLLLAVALLFLITAMPLWAGASKEAKTEAWMKAMTPGAAHASLAEQAGKWRYVLTMWEEPGSEPVKLEGTAVKTMILGGRFLKEEVTSEYQKQAFEGIGITGYDNVTREYVGIWYDNMGTGMTRYTGRDEAKGRQAFRSTMHDPLTGKEIRARSVVRTIDRDHHTYESFVIGENGDERPMMRVEYTRAD